MDMGHDFATPAPPPQAPMPAKCSAPGCGFTTPPGAPNLEIILEFLTLHVRTAHPTAPAQTEQSPQQQPQGPAVMEQPRVLPSGWPQHQQEVPQDDLKEEKEEQDAAKPTNEAEGPNAAKTIPKEKAEDKEPRDQGMGPSSRVGFLRPPWPPDRKPPRRAPNQPINKPLQEMPGEERSTPLPVQSNEEPASTDHSKKASVKELCNKGRGENRTP